MNQERILLFHTVRDTEGTSRFQITSLTNVADIGTPPKQKILSLSLAEVLKLEQAIIAYRAAVAAGRYDIDRSIPK